MLFRQICDVKRYTCKYFFWVEDFLKIYTQRKMLFQLLSHKSIRKFCETNFKSEYFDFKLNCGNTDPLNPTS